MLGSLEMWLTILNEIIENTIGWKETKNKSEIDPILLHSKHI